MIDFFQCDTDDNRRDLLIRARKVALSSVVLYDLDWVNIQFIQLSDTITYKIETSTEGSLLLRIHSGRWSKEEIHSELTFLQTLNQSCHLIVPTGLLSSTNEYVMEIDTEQGFRHPYVTMMRWIEGDHAKGLLSDSCVYNMGQLVGKLHDSTVRLNPSSEFVRPSWGIEHFRSQMNKLEGCRVSFLSDKGWRLYQASAEKIMFQVEGMNQNDDNYGLIHADLHIGNFVFNNDQPYAIDFGRCGYGYLLYDMAATVLGLNPKHRQIYIQGYSSVRKLETDYISDLECFFIMNMIQNYCHHASDSRETAQLISEQPYAQAYLSNFLNNTSFLFEEILPVNIE